MPDIIEFLSIVRWPGAIVVATAFVFASVLVWAVFIKLNPSICKFCGQRTANPSCPDCAEPRPLGTMTTYRSEGSHP